MGSRRENNDICDNQQVVLKYKQDRALCYLARCAGIATGVGILGVGSFQAHQSRLLHNIPLAVMVISGYTFSILQTLTLKAFLKDQVHESAIMCLFRLRTIIIVTASLGLLDFVIFLAVGFNQDSKFVYYALSNAGQWLWVFSFLVFVTTLRCELQVSLSKFDTTLTDTEGMFCEENV